jgi:hypothetical protein
MFSTARKQLSGDKVVGCPLMYLTGNVFLPSVQKLRRTDPFEGRFLFDSMIFNYAMKQYYRGGTTPKALFGGEG